tara:strand:+ start:113 stop:271 length:159 start_codon:yes stop_codon:yes gene_type:complete
MKEKLSFSFFLSLKSHITQAYNNDKNQNTKGAMINTNSIIKKYPIASFPIVL